MESGPPKIIQWLIPPACREEVSGDFREEGANPGTMLHAIICIVFSRIRRTTDPVVLLMEALALYTAFAVIAQYQDRALLIDPTGLLRLAIPPAAVLLTVMIADAYSDPKKRWIYKPLIALIPAGALGLTAGLFALPQTMALLGTGFGALLMLPIRWTFPPITERPQATAGPAFWQKLELAPIGAVARYVAAMVICALLTLVIWMVYAIR